MTEEELLIKAAEERLSIVNKYDRGRENAEQIDPWEDPAFEIYHVTDRYGFIHDKRLPESLKPDIRDRDLENSRLKKWLKMINPRVWDHELKTGKLKKRLYKGIPDAVRGEVWSRLLHIQKTKAEQKDKYEEMRKLARLWSPDLRQIDLDVNRTYRDHLMFRERYGLKQQALFHILGAYSVYNAEIGYCQGMSQVAALLLMYLDEEDAFWGLSNLMADPKWAMHGFFIPGFPKLIRFQQHHDRVITKLLPKLKKHFDRQNIDAGLYTLKWFFQCFLDRVPFSLTLRLWDIYFFEGENLLVSMAYCLLKMHRRTVCRMGMEEILEFMQMRLPQNFGYVDNVVVETLEKCMEELKRLKLDVSKQIPDVELAQKPFGVFQTPSVDVTIGRRRTEFSEEEKSTRATVVARMELQGRSQQQGSYLSIDDMSFDPSIDDISSGFQRSSRSSLDGTSAASAADFSTLSVTPSHRYLSNEEAQAAAEEADAADEAEARSLSCASVISIDKEMKRDQFRISSSSSTITTTTTTTTAITKVTEYAVVHHQRSDVHNVNNQIRHRNYPIPATPLVTSPASPVFPEETFDCTDAYEDKSLTPTKEHDGVDEHSTPDRVRIYVPFCDELQSISAAASTTSTVNGTGNGLAYIPSSNSPSPIGGDPNRVVIRVDNAAKSKSSTKKSKLQAASRL